MTQTQFASIANVVSEIHTGVMAGIEEFGDLLRRARTQLGVDQEELGAKLGRDGSFVSRYENGKAKNPPDPWMFRQIESALGLDPTEMLIALGYLERAGSAASPRDTGVPGELVAKLRSVADWPRWKVTYMLNAIDNMQDLEKQIVLIAEQGDSVTVDPTVGDEDSEGRSK